MVPEASGGSLPRHDSPVRLARPPGRELGLRGDQGGPFERDNQTAGCVGIEPVHQPRTVAPTREEGEPILDIGSAARTGMHRQPGRFVQNHKPLVTKQEDRLG